MKKIVRLTESDLHRIVKESVKRILREDIQPNHEEIWNKIERAWNDARNNRWSNNPRRGFMDSLAWIMVDNNLTIDDLKEYGNVLQIVDVDYLNKEIESCHKYMEWEKADDKRREAEAWAEEQMSDMGFGFEGD